MEAGGGSKQGVYDPGAMALAANFPGETGASMVRRIEKAIRHKNGITFPEMLSIAYPKVRDQDIESFADAVKAKDKDWELLANPVFVADERRRAAEELESWSSWIDAMWPTWDVDNSGELDEHEFKAVIRDLGGSSEDVDIFFKQVDVDSSGAISREEFNDWWLGQGSHAHSSIVGKKKSSSLTPLEIPVTSQKNNLVLPAISPTKTKTP
ncbi:hypothetical protein CYMTET_7645 [Cymbomonas tetramitiformis]|uniref:EF-hand domain-containing protein n=1 Tax=Cymbomonas tetramitiformis TaxID=36881 RepID=A0AAE0BBI1_9CHLO|nr:hypothetical protein CYMTET_57014 [Cymbomonas tetramitiformis]KAK3284717.1 hypothetical protein CYMTET_7645 [Cymbomonas tetramitiformis]